MKVPVPMIPSSGGVGVVIAAVILIALVAFAVKRVIDSPPNAAPTQR